jgi:cell division protein FtsQ
MSLDIIAFMRSFLGKKKYKYAQAQRYKAQIDADALWGQMNDRSQWGLLFKKMFKTVLVGSFFVILLWGTWSFRQNNHLSVSKVQIIATYDHVDPKALQEMIQPHLTGNFFDIDVANLRADLLAIPWIQDVTIRRKWPDMVVVSVTEQQPVAQWKEVALLGATGKLFTPSKNTFPVGLPLLLGPEEQIQEIIKNYRQMQNLLRPLDFKVTQLILDEQHSWHIVLRGRHNDINVLLGNEEVVAKLQNFVTAYPKIIKNHAAEAIRIVDLRYKNGIAVR